MYNEQIENLINLALADGELTEKEKQILFKKAEAAGIDLDEFEMVLDAKLFKTQQIVKDLVPSNAAPVSEKSGDVVGIYQELEENEKVIESYQETAEFVFGKGAGGNSKETRVQGRLFITNHRILILKFVSYGEEKSSYDFSEMGNWYDVPLAWVKQIGHNTQTKKSWFTEGDKSGDKKGLTITIESPLERTVTQKSGFFGNKTEEVKVKDTYSLEIVLSNVSALEMKIQGILAKHPR